MGKGRDTYRVLVEKPKGKRPLGKPRSRWDNIKICKKWEGGMDRIDLAQDRDRWRALVNTFHKMRIIS
jgi:hypothetical protein